jgi:signal transduction histidine kinase
MNPRRSIAWKLLASYGLVLLVAVATHLLIAYPLAAGHITEYARQAGTGSALPDHLLESLRGSLLWAGLAAVVVATLFALFLARGITRPVQRMMEATRRMAAGDYRERVAVASSDELGQLAAALNEMAAGLERVEGLRRELVANVAHELRTPLAGLEGYLEGITDGVFEPTPETLARMRAETARLRRLVEDLTALSHLESGQWRLERRPVQLAHVAATVEDALRPQVERQGVRLRVTVDDGLPRVLGDADRLAQVLTNLLSNALRFTPPGGQVTVEGWPERDSVCLAVRDTGSGIAPHDLPHIFERFYRADRARAQATGGSGIGLAIAKHIVEAHGGTVSVQSAPGQGTRFEVRLPLFDSSVGSRRSEVRVGKSARRPVEPTPDTRHLTSDSRLEA